MKKEVEEVLGKIQTALAADGGGISLVDVDEEEGIVKVELTGACVGCPKSQMTMTGVVERTLKQEVEGVNEVVAV